MFLNIITPCSRPENLHKIAESINIPRENYRWIVVFDLDILPDSSLIPSNCENYLHKNPQSGWGNSQRNFALDIIKEGHVYFNDDDTIIHTKLWENIKDSNEDFISFSQVEKWGALRLKGDIVKLNYIDSHNFIVKKEVAGDSRFIIDRYNADGIFAEECYNKSNSKIFIDKILSVYNSLR